MIYKKIRRILIMAIILIFGTILSGCGNKKENQSVVEYGELEIDEEKKNPKQETETAAKQSLPTYDKESATEEPTTENILGSVEPESYYYRKWLNDVEGETAASQAVAEVYKSAKNFKNNAALQRPISPEMVQKVMNIIFLDNPELYMLNNSYSYSVNDFGEVSEIFLEYCMTQEEYETEEDRAITQKARFLKDFITDSKSLYKSINSFISDIRYDFREIKMDSEGGYDRSAEQLRPVANDSYYNSVGMSKYIAYWLKQMGIETTIVLGEPISNTLEQSGYSLTDDYIPFMQDNVDESGVHHVEMNYSHYWCWNVVKMNDEWYNLDVVYAKMLEENFNISAKYALFVPDQIMSQTRLFHMTEDILGVSPSCTDINFQQGYREGIYVLPHTESQMIVRIGQEISAIDQINATQKMWQFQNEESFNYFINNFNKQLEIYNENNKSPIGKCDMEITRDILLIRINNIVHNN